MELNNPGGFRSRRSYPNLHHVSLAPLTPRFPIDDDIEPPDYFSPRDTLDNQNSGSKTPPRTSYFSSVSVPSTPPILSHSRSTSRTRNHHHTRSKSSSRAATFSDSNLQSHAHTRDISLPFHHHHNHSHQHHKKTASSPHVRRHQTEHSHGHGHNQHPNKSDAEWMLRAGIALASSTREEKGQSWLSKRESSTSLVSEIPVDIANDPAHHRHHRRTKSGSSRKSRSGASTPGGPSLSRRSSRSRGGSRRGSRAGLTMTSMPFSSSSSSAMATAVDKNSGTVSPEVRGRNSGSGSGFEADFVDERIRAEMASLQQGERGFGGLHRGEGEYEEGDEEEFWDGEDYEDDGSEYDYSTDETPDEFDEADLQRLTRERGFGLGGWIDRLVEWTLFGVEEWPAPVSSAATRIGTTPTTTTVTFEEPQPEEDQGHDSLSLSSAEHDRYSDFDTVSHTDGESGSVEKPGEQGGWEDASWLFRVVKRAII